MRRSVVADVCDAVVAQQEQRPLRCREALPLASALLDGELGDGDAARVRAHISACEACRQEFGLMRSCAALLAERETVEPPAALRPRILQAVADAPVPPIARSRMPVWRAVAALGSSAAVAAALIVAILHAPWGSRGQREPEPAPSPVVIADRPPAADLPVQPADQEPAAATPTPDEAVDGADTPAAKPVPAVTTPAVRRAPRRPTPRPPAPRVEQDLPELAAGPTEPLVPAENAKSTSLLSEPNADEIAMNWTKGAEPIVADYDPVPEDETGPI